MTEREGETSQESEQLLQDVVDAAESTDLAQKDKEEIESEYLGVDQLNSQEYDQSLGQTCQDEEPVSLSQVEVQLDSLPSPGTT